MITFLSCSIAAVALRSPCAALRCPCAAAARAVLSAQQAQAATVRVQLSTDYRAAAKLLHDNFGGQTFYYYTTLRAPALNANVFFEPVETLCALALDGDNPRGVVQLLLARLRKEAGSGAGKTVAFVQSVAVPPESRRRGIATQLVRWCEEEAWQRWGDVELWLAIAVGNSAAQALYEGLNYEVVEKRMQIILMRKVPTRAPRPSTAAADTVAPATSTASPPREALARTAAGGLDALELAKNVATQGMYVAIAAFGISVLLTPFGGPSLGTLLLPEPLPLGLVQLALGVALALAELRRQGVDPLAAVEASERLDYTSAQALQMAPLFRIAGGERSAAAALVALGSWQLSIALAEELYYRGLLQSGAAFGLGSLAGLVGGGAPPAPLGALMQVVALVFASAVFGAVHTEWAAGPSFGADASPATAPSGGPPADSKADWFLQTGAYGAAFGLLTLLTHNVLASVAMHATLNAGLCARDWRRMRNTPESELARIFAATPESID